MAIIKTVKTTEYAQIHNSALQNPNLSAKAKGILACVMSLPADWVLHKTKLHTFFKDGRDAIIGGFDELIEHGYAIEIEGRNEKGHFQNVYYVSDIPFTEEHVRELTVTENPERNIRYGFSGNTNKDTQKKYKQNDEEDKRSSLSPATTTLKVGQGELPSIPSLNVDDINWITDKVRGMFNGKIQKRSFDAVAKKCINNYAKGTVPNYENYLITAIENKINELEARKGRESKLLEIAPKVITRKRQTRKEMIPAWLARQDNDESTTVGQATPEPQERLEEMQKKLEEELKKYKK